MNFIHPHKILSRSSCKIEQNQKDRKKLQERLIQVIHTNRLIIKNINIETTSRKLQSIGHTFSTKDITESVAVQKKMQSRIREMESLLYEEKLKV